MRQSWQREVPVPVNNITLHTWWKIARVHPHLMKKICFVMSLLMGSQPKCFQCNFNRSTCALCCDGPDVLCHILFQCEALNPERLVHWQTIVKEMPLAMSGEVSELPDQIKIEYLLSGLNNSYIHEWQNLYESIADFISIMYKKRHELYNRETATVN